VGDKNDSADIAHYMTLDICPQGYRFNGYSCIPPEKVAAMNKWIILYTFPSATYFINKVLEFWFQISNEDIAS